MFEKMIMDGNTAIILGGFITTWVQIAMLYYKIGKLEQKVKDLNNLYKKNYAEKRD